MTVRKRVVTFAAAGLTLAAVAAGWYLYRALPIGTGYTAKYLCSGVFLSQRDPRAVFDDDIRPVNILTRVITTSVDPAARTVSARALGLIESTAVYREGCGCTLLAGIDPSECHQRSPHLPPRPQLPADQPWPLGSAPVQPSPGINHRALDSAIDHAFAEPDPVHPRHTRAVAVVFNGRLVAERYAPGFHRHTKLPGWSMSKSVTNALVGILVRQGRLDIEAPAPVPEWQTPGDPRRAISLNLLLRMSSGLAFEETYAPLKDATDMLYGSADFGAFAAAKPLAAKPGTRWQYSSGTANIVARLVRHTIGGSQDDYLGFVQRELLDRIGMTETVVELDPSGTIVGSSYTYGTARDWARFGQLFLQDGVWEGRRILPPGWVAYSTTPAPAAPQGKYGAHFWLNAGTPDRPEDRRWPELPRDAYFAMGYQGQNVGMVPSRGLVVVRLGLTVDRSAWDLGAFVADILAALPPLPADRMVSAAL